MANSPDSPISDRKATFDPGWNDPPTFSYTAQKTTPGRPRNFLNKRVAFPLGGSNSSSGKPLVNPLCYGSGPPTAAALEPKGYNVQTIEPNEDIDSEKTLNEVKTILFELLDQSIELGPKASDIKRRISVMEDMWCAGKLSKRVQLQVRELAVALKQNEPHKADEIHQVLMVDHVSSVSSWMPGVKLLIRNCISRAELLSIEN